MAHSEHQDENLEYKTNIYNVTTVDNIINNEDCLSDITSSEESFSQKYIIFCKHDCCWNIDEDSARVLTIKMDTISKNERNILMFNRHYELTSYHRIMLLDWLMEISSCFRLSRETYSIALDYLDRFLSLSSGLYNTNILVIGVTCMYMASKVEEVTSLKLIDLLFLSDYLVSDSDVLNMEKKILQTLNWRCCIWTVNKWLFVLLHIAKFKLTEVEYFKITELLDLVTLDSDSLMFSYSVLASSCLYLVTSRFVYFPFNSETHKLAISECSFWMKSYWEVLQRTDHTDDNFLTTDQHTCKLFNNSIHQRYTNLIDIYLKVRIKGVDEL